MAILYRHFDEAGRLLYVGVSNVFESRTRAHLSGSEWGASVATITLERFHALQDALEAERTAIMNERPAYNCVPGPRKRRAVSTKKNGRADNRELLSEISAFIQAHGMAASAFGRETVNDLSLIPGLEAGRELRSRTLRAIRHYMATGQRLARDEAAA